MVPKLQIKCLFLQCVVAFDPGLWSPQPSRTPCNENGRFSTLQKMSKVWSLCSLLKIQQRPDRETGQTCRARTEIFSHICSLLEEKGQSGCSLQVVCQAKTTKHAMVWPFLTQWQKKPKTERQHLVQNSTNG